MLQSIFLRYLKGTVDYGLKYVANQKINLEGYVDLDWVGSAIDRKKTLGCCFNMGSCTVISWFSKNQSCVALSTAEAEYVTTYLASCEAVWMRKLLSDLFDLPVGCYLYTLWQPELREVFHDKSKHIEIKYHYIRDMGQRGAVKLQYVATEEQIADVLTKPLARVKFEYFREKLGVL